MVKPGAEELRQKVFSSTHMSTMVKTAQATVTYPCCSYCGGYLNSSQKRKVVFGQLSLYTNPSESFIVWYKKHDEPKGLLWLRNCCIKKGHEGTEIQVITRGCRERCSYTLSFLALSTADEWYWSLKQESRRVPSIGSGIFCEELDSASSLDSILNEVTPSYGDIYYYSDSDENWSDDTDPWYARQSAAAKDSAQFKLTASISTRRPLVKESKMKSHPSLRYQGPRNVSPILVSSLANEAGLTSAELLHVSTNDVTEDQLSRWSWPLHQKAWVTPPVSILLFIYHWSNWHTFRLSIMLVLLLSARSFSSVSQSKFRTSTWLCFSVVHETGILAGQYIVHVHHQNRSDRVSYRKSDTLGNEFVHLACARSTFLGTICGKPGDEASTYVCACALRDYILCVRKVNRRLSN